MSFSPVTIVSNVGVAIDLHHLVIEAPGIAAQHTLPGQFLQLTVGDSKPAFLAIASAPGAAQIELLIKRTDGTAGALCDLQPGATAQSTDVMGRGFPLERAAGKTPLMFVTGSGISAMRSVIESRDWAGTGATLYYGCLSRAHMAWQDRFAAWEARGVRVIAIVDRETDGHDGPVGFVQDVYAAAPVPDASAAVLFLCGLPQMCEAAKVLMLEAGMPEAQILMNY